MINYEMITDHQLEIIIIIIIIKYNLDLAASVKRLLRRETQ
jgi:hypothetical protein